MKDIIAIFFLLFCTGVAWYYLEISIHEKWPRLIIIYNKCWFGLSMIGLILYSFITILELYYGKHI